MQRRIFTSSHPHLMEIVIEVESWKMLCDREGERERERELRDIAAGRYRSTGLDKAVLETELLDIAARSYTSSGLEKAVLERKLRNKAAGSYRSKCLEKAVLKRAAGLAARSYRS